MPIPLVNRDASRAYLNEYCKIHTHDYREQKMAFQQLVKEAELGRRDQTDPFPTSIGTLFLHAQATQQIWNDIRILMEACTYVRRLFLEGDTRLARIIHIDKDELALIRAEQPIQHTLFGAVRVDIFPTEHGNTISEINTDNPDGILILNTLIPKFVDTFLLPTYRNTISKPPPIGILLEQSMRSILGEFHSLGVLGPLDKWFIGENHQTVRYFKEKGIDARMHNPSAVTQGKENVHAEGHTFTKARRVAETHTFAKSSVHHPDILQALQKKTLRVYNAFSDRILGHKSLFHLFTDTSYRDLFTKEQQNVFDTYIPWTRVCTESTVLYNNKKYTLTELLRQKQHTLVLKPSGGAEAEGVMLGSEVSEHQWDERIKLVLSEPHNWIVQEKIQVQRMPILHEDTQYNPVVQDCITDISFHAFGSIEGLLKGHFFSRYSSEPINNIINGGGFLFPLQLTESPHAM